MKMTFRAFRPGDTVDARGRHNLTKTEIIEVTRMDVECFLTNNPQMPAMTQFMFWLSNGEKYSMIMSGAPVPAGKDVDGTTDGKAVRKETKSDS